MHLFPFASAGQPGPGGCNINCFFADLRTWAYSSSASNRSTCFHSSISEVVVNCERKLQQHSGITSQVLLCASWNCGNSFKNFHCCLGCPLSWGSRNTHTLLPWKEACVHLLQKFRQTDGFVKVQWWFWCQRLLYSSIANCLARM